MASSISIIERRLPNDDMHVVDFGDRPEAELLIGLNFFTAVSRDGVVSRPKRDGSFRAVTFNEVEGLSSLSHRGAVLALAALVDRGASVFVHSVSSAQIHDELGGPHWEDFWPRLVRVTVRFETAAVAESRQVGG